MPCYLFTWHTYGSWLPDRPQGYVHWSRGRQSSNIALAECYRQQQKQTTALLTETLQLEITEEIIDAAEEVGFKLHFVATETTHVHALVSWRNERHWKQLRRSIRRSLTERLNRFERRKWFSRGGDAQQVKDREHFDYLTSTYLPSHSGWKWCEHRSLFK